MSGLLGKKIQNSVRIVKEWIGIEINMIYLPLYFTLETYDRNKKLVELGLTKKPLVLKRKSNGFLKFFRRVLSF